MADNSSLLRNGNKILIDQEPYLIQDNSFVNPGKGQAFTKVKIKNLLNGKVLEKTIKSVSLSKKQMLLIPRCSSYIKRETHISL